MVCFAVLSGHATVGGGGRAHRAVAGCRSSDERCGVCYGHLTGEWFFSPIYFSEMKQGRWLGRFHRIVFVVIVSSDSSFRCWMQLSCSYGTGVPVGMREPEWWWFWTKLFNPCHRFKNQHQALDLSLFCCQLSAREPWGLPGQLRTRASDWLWA